MIGEAEQDKGHGGEKQRGQNDGFSADLVRPAAGQATAEHAQKGCRGHDGAGNVRAPAQGLHVDGKGGGEHAVGDIGQGGDQHGHDENLVPEFAGNGRSVHRITFSIVVWQKHNPFWQKRQRTEQSKKWRRVLSEDTEGFCPERVLLRPIRPAGWPRTPDRC